MAWTTQLIALCFICLLVVAWGVKDNLDVHKELREEREALKRALETPPTGTDMHKEFRERVDNLKMAVDELPLEEFDAHKEIRDQLHELREALEAPPPPPFADRPANDANPDMVLK